MTQNQEQVQQIVREHIEKKTAVIGTKRVLKGLRGATLQTVFVTHNAPQYIKEDLARYTSLDGTELVQLAMSNKELGIACKRPFNVSVLGIMK